MWTPGSASRDRAGAKRHRCSWTVSDGKEAPPKRGSEERVPGGQRATGVLSTFMNLFGSSLSMRRCAKSPKHAIAQSFGIALTGFCKIHDLVREYFIGKVAVVSKSKRYQGHFVREAHDPDRLGIELVTI